MKSLGSAKIYVIGSLLAAHAVGQTVAPVPDIILTNGRVFTATESPKFAQAVAINGDRIQAIGRNEDISALAGPHTRRIDLEGRLVIPGLNDLHTHMPGAGFAGKMLNFGDPAATWTTVKNRIREAAASERSGTLLLGIIAPDLFFDPACTPGSLDEVAPNIPVILFTSCFQAAILNKAASAKYGPRPQDPPPRGGFFGKDMKSKTWDGVVHEGAWFRILASLLTDNTHADEDLKNFLDREARWGVTSVTGMEAYPSARLKQLSSVKPQIRLRLIPDPVLHRQNGREDPQEPTVPSALADRVTVSGIKFRLDGSPCERSAATRSPYADDRSTSGQLNLPPDHLRDILADARDKRVQPVLHCLGDRTVESLFTQMERTGGPNVWAERRLRIEHGDGVMPDLIPRARKLAVIVVRNPDIYPVVRDMIERRLGSERAARSELLRSLVDSGIPVAIATDGNASSPLLNPYVNIMSAVTYPGRPEEALTRRQAVIAHTRTAAYAEFAEAEKGTIEPGKLADLAVLSQDIFEVPIEDLPKTESVLTIVGGRVVHDRLANTRVKR